MTPPPTAPSLRAYARDPAAYASPLPADHRRITRGGIDGYRRGWPARLLAIPALAADMADLGAAYARTTGRTRGGLTLNGEPAFARSIALLAVDIIREAATELAAHPDLDDAAAATVQGLNYTANDIEESSRAEANFLGGIRPLLPAPDADPVDAFLASFDGTGDVAQPVLLAAYTAAGAPGALGRNRLYERAGARWDAAKAHSARVFRTSTPRTVEAALADELAALIDRHGLAAIDAELALLRTEGPS